jgi:hypothetical protein
MWESKCDCIHLYQYCRIPCLIVFTALASGILQSSAVSQTLDSLPSFAQHCQGIGELPTKVEYSYSYSRVIESPADTLITHDIRIGADSALYIKSGARVRFADRVRIIIDGGTLVIGQPETNATASEYRSADSVCACDQVVLRNDQAAWHGILVRPASNVYIYGTVIEGACTGLSVEGPPSPSGNWCEEPAIYNAANVWVECTSLRSPAADAIVDCPTNQSSFASAAIYLHGENARFTRLHRVNIAAGFAYQEGVRVQGDARHGACRAPHMSNIHVADSRYAGVEVVHADTAGLCSDIDPETGQPRVLMTEVVASSLHISSSLKYGIKLYGAVRMRFTECEGGLDVTRGDSLQVPAGSLEIGVFINTGLHYREFDTTALRAGLYMNHYMTRLILANATKYGIHCDRKGEFVDSAYASTLIIRNNGVDSTCAQVYASKHGRIRLSTNAANADTSYYHYREVSDTILSGANRLYAETSAEISIVAVHWCAEYGQTVFPPVTQGGGPITLGEARRDTAKPHVPLVIRYCNEKSETVYYKPVNAMLHREGEVGLRVYPEPSRESVVLSVISSTGNAVGLCIYSILGELVYKAELSSGTSPIARSVLWNGRRHDTGALVSPGVYVVVAQSGSVVVTKKLTVIR